MQKTVVIDVVGLSRNLVGPYTPFLQSWIDNYGASIFPIAPVLPAVTTTAQTTYVTGKWPSEHGIVGNGWYFREEAEVRFWSQSNKLIQVPIKVWDAAKQQDPSFTCSKMFWWYNMYSSADYSVTPRPMYPSDGRKIPDVYANPPALRTVLQEKFGQFPLFKFWGPRTSIEASEWIAEASKYVDNEYDPTLTLIYLPHLDYCLQKFGGNDDASRYEKDLREVDTVVADLVRHYEASGARVILLSEYGVAPVRRPVHINRALRTAGLLAVREELGVEQLLDCGASAAFAIADHQIAHVYINADDQAVRARVLKLLRELDGVDLVLEEDGKRENNIDHPRAGDIVCVAEADAWFTYYFWEDDAKAPDYARCVSIHRKPGYDPVEMFVDPTIQFPMMKAGLRLLQKELGFRYLMDLIPLDATLVQGSHGHLTKDPDAGAILMTRHPELLGGKKMLEAVDVFDVILRHLNLKARHVV